MLAPATNIFGCGGMFLLYKNIIEHAYIFQKSLDKIFK